MFIIMPLKYTLSYAYHHDFTDLEIHGMVRNTKNKISELWLFYKVRKFLHVPQMVHFEKLSFLSGAYL